LPEERRNDYQLLAADILSNKLYHDLLTEVRRSASVKMFNESQVIDDILFAKAMLYTIYLMDTKLKLIKSGLTNEARQIK